MGAWGTAISSNDTYADVYEAFFELYNDGLDVQEISRSLVKKNQDIIKDSDDCNNFWFALARAQWECKQLDPELHKKVKNIIDTGADIDVWRRLDADEKDGGAVVLEAIYDTEYGYSLIAATRINKPDKPNLKDFESSTVLVQNFANWKNTPNIHWYSPIKHKDVIDRLEIIGKIRVDKTYSYYVNNATEYGSCTDFGFWIIGQTSRQFAFEKENDKPKTVTTIRELIKGKKWKLW